MKTLRTILIKEFRQFRRDSFLPRLCVMFPFMIMLIMPLVTTMDVRNVNVVVVDNDGKDFSRLLMDKIAASEYLTLADVTHSYDKALRMVEQDEADVIVEINPSKGSMVRSADYPEICVSANSVNGMKGTLGLQYITKVLSSLSSREGWGTNGLGASVRFMFNPTLNYRFFMIPALMVMLVIMLCGFLPALNLVGEKEKGTIEQINVTPIHPVIFTLGKLIPYWIIGLLVITIAIPLAYLVYGLPVAGSLFTLYLASIIFIVFMSSVGVAIANKSQTMQQAMFVMFFFVVVFILMSGLMTPVQSMPQWAQMLTSVIPPRYFIDIMRGTWLRGAGILDQHFLFLALTASAVLACLVAVITYKKQQ